MNFLNSTVESNGQFLRGPGFQLRMSDRIAQTLIATSKKSVVAGIRPEHLFPAEDRENFKDSGGGWVQGRIELIEPLGSQVMVQVAIGDTTVTAQFERQTGLEVGKSITLKHKVDTPHAFDAEAERSVLAGADVEARVPLVKAA